MSIGRNAPCHCGSGKKYKHCHLEIDNASPKKRLFITQDQYSKSWQKNADHYMMQGCYDWIVDQIAKYKPTKIFDVGCGNGHGLKSLATRFPAVQIASIEENKVCIDQASKLLRTANIQVDIIARMNHVITGSSGHELIFDASQFIIPSGVSIIEGDIVLQDNLLYDALIDSGPYDLVTVWLIGSHLLRHECENIASLRISSSGEYRLRVQNKVYQLADEILRPGGVLQVVDRGEPPDTDVLKNDIIRAHREQASSTSLEFVDLQYREYSEASESGSIVMEITPGLLSTESNSSRMAMVSIISKKPFYEE